MATYGYVRERGTESLHRKLMSQPAKFMRDFVVAEETTRRYYGITAGLTMLNQLSLDDRAEFDAAAKWVT